MRKVYKNKLTINDLPTYLPDFKNSEMPKDRLTEKWLTEWIVSSLSANKIKSGDILPQKHVIAQYLGVSTGTVQNAIRYTEDKGFLQSKQKTGTMIAELYVHTDTIKKQTSKRDAAVYKIKKFIVENGINSVMPPASDIAKMINVSANTVRLAYLHLCDTGILRYSAGKSGKKILRVINLPTLPKERISASISLVEKTTQLLADYITENLKKGDKLQTRLELSEILNVSVKTVHDAVNKLEEKGILLSRRGRYGTVIVKMPNEANNLQPMNERSIFAKAENAVYYRWEKIQNKLSDMIKNEYEAGMKLPSMETLSKKFNVSTNTIRKALKILNQKGIVEFERGRYGGTFVTDLPEKEDFNTYEWIAITPGFIPMSAKTSL